MKKIMISVFLGIGLATLFSLSAKAASITDTVVFNTDGTAIEEDLISYGGGTVDKIGDSYFDWVTWEHSFAFDFSNVTVGSVVLSLTFEDDQGVFWVVNSGWWGYCRYPVVTANDSESEWAVGWTDDGQWDIGEVETGTYEYDIDIESILDGSLIVTISGSFITGDFYVVSSELTVNYTELASNNTEDTNEINGNNPVPEPSTFLMIGLSLLALSGLIRKRA